MNTRAAVIILNYNGKTDTLACLESVYRSAGAAVDAIVVDNASVDDSVSALKAAYPALTLVENSRNLGFAAGCNQGIRLALERGNDPIVLLNNDTVVAPDALSLLSAYLDKDKRVGAVAPLIFYRQDKARVWSAGGRIDWLRGIWTDKGDRRFLAGQPYEVDAVSGCCLVLPAQVLRECGLFEEKLFLYGEDIDLCQRIRGSGRNVAVLPAAHIWHAVGATVGGSETPAYRYYTQRNRLYFMRKYTRGWRWSVFCAYFFFSAAAQCLRCVLRGQPAACRAVAAAVRDFFNGRYGQLREGRL